ncbi:MAG: NADH-quinone oxidoreductase subunit M [Mycobacterium leprae]
MTRFPWLSVLVLVPLVGAVAVWVLPARAARAAKSLALAVSLAVLALTVAAALQFDPGGARFQFTERHGWIPRFGIDYALGVDGIALVLIALTAALMPVVVLSSWYDAEESRHGVPRFFALLLITEAMVIGSFAATDVFLFYVLFEAMLVPMYFLIGSYGGARRSYAAVKFLLYNLLGGLLMLVAVIGLYVVSSRRLGAGTFAFGALADLNLSGATAKWLFLGFFIAFAIKAPLWPFHTWLPDAAAEAPIGTAALLSGVVDKVGTYGFLRFCLVLFPGAARDFAPWIIALAVVGVLYGALLAVGQADLKRFVAYSSVSHFGFITLGVFALTTQGGTGSTFYMVNHGFSTAALFFAVGFLVARRRSALIADYGGVANVAPWLAGTFLVAALSALSLPGLSTFVSEFLVLLGTFTRYPVPAVLATVGIILAALYALHVYQRTMHGPLRDTAAGGGHLDRRDLNRREAWVIGPVLAVMLALGVYPKPALDLITPAADRTLQEAGVGDREPTATWVSGASSPASGRGAGVTTGRGTSGGASR